MINIKINIATWFILIVSFLCGYINYSLIILMIILCHELGHIITIKLFHYKINKIEIFPFGGVIKLEKDLNTPVYKELLIAVSGIIMQLILFLIMPNILSSYNYDIFRKYNLAIMLFNLLPIIPLDGSIILNAFLNKFIAFKNSLLVSSIVSMVMIALYISFNYWYSLNNYFIVSLFLLKTFKYIKEREYLFNKFLLERYLNNYNFKYLSTKEGNLDILKIDTYQYFKDKKKVISEKEMLKERFNK